ncbi:hypothetical protein WJX81_004089 [Elliptochloris bilobata]|uniref:Uncharacterized protein n=1 Tax=Elliptochloris bilobata TaxID=381761 RepID=A0AAW1S441_9CHLO
MCPRLRAGRPRGGGVGRPGRRHVCAGPRGTAGPAGCDVAPASGDREVEYRRLKEDDAEDPEASDAAMHVVEEAHAAYHVTKTSQWFLLSRAHADEQLLGQLDEFHLGTLLDSHRLQNETTCDWQGPTCVNWTIPGDHPHTYHTFDAGLLRRMRRSSIFAGMEHMEFAGPMNPWPAHASRPLFDRKLAPVNKISTLDAAA